MSHSFSSLLLIKMMAHVRQLGGLISRAARLSRFSPVRRSVLAFILIAGVTAGVFVWRQASAAKNSAESRTARSRTVSAPTGAATPSPAQFSFSIFKIINGATPVGNAISGTLFDANEIPITSADKTITLLINGVAATPTSSVGTDGAGLYLFPDVTYTTGDILSVYVDGDATVKGATVTRGDTGDVTNLNITQDMLTVRNEDSGSQITNPNLNTGNPGSDPDLNAVYTVSGGGVLTTPAGKSLTIFAGSTFTPGGAIVDGGNWIKNGTFNAGVFTVTLNGTANQTIGGLSNSLFNNLSINNTGTSPNNVVSLAVDTNVGGTLDVTGGVFDQGATFSLITTGSATNVVSVAAAGIWRNLGTGDLTLSSGVSNLGTIEFNANGTPCVNSDLNDDIQIRSSFGGNQRTWSGSGTFSMTDVDVADQRVPGGITLPLQIIVNSGTNSDNNTGWTFVNTCASGTYKWIGGASQDWQVPTNWTPTRATPNTADVLVFDGATTPSPIVNNVPTETDAEVDLEGGALVTLNASSLGAPQTLTLSGGASQDRLKVPSGSSLTLAGSSALQISLTNTSTAAIGGLFIMQDGAHRLLGAAGAINFNSGSIFTTAAGFTGNPFGTVTNGSVTFASGSSAFFNAGGDPFGGDGNSVAQFNQGSSQTFTVKEAFSSAGRTYGNLTLSGSQAYTATGTSTNTVFGTLTINSGSSLTLSPSAGGDLILLGDFTNNGGFDANGRAALFQGGANTQTINGGVTFFDLIIGKSGGSVKVGNSVTVSHALNYNGATDVLDIAGADLTLNGTVGGTNANGALDSTVYGANGPNLHIGGTGALGPLRYLGTQNLKVLEVNRLSGVVTFGTGLNIGDGSSGSVALTNGIVDMGSNTLSLATFPTIARTNGYVIGNLQKNFGAPGGFTFPVGTANGYSPLDASVTVNTSGTLTVKAAPAAPGKQPNIPGTNALQRYWTLSGSGLTADLTFHYNASSPNDIVGNEALYKVFKYDGSLTQPANQSVNTGTHTATVTGVTAFSDWTLAEGSSVFPDLALTKTDSPDPVTEGNYLTYLITATNNGVNATGVVIDDPLPANVTYVSATPSQGTCTFTTTVNCGLGAINSGNNATVTIVVTPTNAAVNTTLSNTATVTETETDANNADNSATATTQVVAAVCTAPPGGMLSWYAAENNANDIYGPNNGALINGTGFATGKVGQAFSFDGDDDRVEVDPPGSLNITGDKLTMDGWINPVANTNSFYFGRSAPSDHPYVLYFNSGTNSIHIITRTNPGSQVESDTLYAPPTNRWTHIALVYDGANTRFYANGAEVFTAAQTGNLDSSSLPFIIGNRPGEGPGTSFNGLIDEVEVFAQALSPADIAAIYNASSAGKCHNSTLQFNSATYSVSENVGGGNATITVTRTGAHDTAVSVDYATVAGGTATGGGSCTGTTDYVNTSGPLSFAANETSKTFDVPICNDTIFEPDETVSLQLSNASGPGASLGSPTGAVLTIQSEDAQPTITIADASQNELNSAASNFVFNVTLSNPSSTDVVINYSTADGTTNPANAGSDYTAIPSGILTIPANSTSGTINVSVNGDTTVEPDETFLVNLTGVTGASMPDTQALGTIINDDTDVSVAVSPLAVAEDGAPNLVYTFTRTGVTTGILQVNFLVAGTAILGTDYTETGADTFTAASGTVTFGAGISTAQVTVDPTLDSTIESDETVILTMNAGAGYNVGSPNAATGTITNDDTDVTIAVSASSVVEDGPTNLDFTFTRNPETSGPITVNFTVGGTATSGTDYTASGAASFGLTSGSVIIPNGATTATVTINPTGDTAVEGDEDVSLTITSGTGYNVGATNSASATIVDDDTDISVAVSPPSVAEDDLLTNPVMVYTFTRTGVTSGAITVNFSVGGTATYPGDYAVSGATSFTASSGTVTFGDGVTSVMLTLDPNTDAVYELNEPAILTVTSGSGYNPGTPASATGTINNNDTAPTLGIGDKIANEGTTGGPTTNFVFTVTRTGNTEVAATVNFATSDGTTNPATGGASCTSGVDYITQNGMLTFPASAGPNSQTITILVCKDATVESNETFFIDLSGETDATIGDGQGRGTIQNDDSPGTVLTVNTTDDVSDGICDAHCTLREAITALNGSGSPEKVGISFAIPFGDSRHFYYADDGVVGQVTNDVTHVLVTTASNDTSIVGIDPDWPHSWWSILPTSSLPPITHRVVVDGYTQTGATANDGLGTGDNAVLRLELNGASAGASASGLTLTVGTSDLGGLVINRFSSHGLDLQGGTSNSVVGNFIGTDVSGTLDLGNTANGISTSGNSLTIGGSTPADVNLISGNNGTGIAFSNSNTDLVLGNLIGTKANGTSALGNGGTGISFTGTGGSGFNTIGGTQPGDGNTITFNGDDGVQVSTTGGFGNAIRGNSIFSNGTTNLHLGIDLGADGVTANDVPSALDADTGANNLQNFPVITQALVTGSTKTINGTLDSKASEIFDIDFYASPSCDTSGNGEGQTYLGSVPNAATDANGHLSFTFHPDLSHAPGMTVGKVITATATSTGASSSTSEFSACFPVSDGSSGAGDIQFTSATYSVGEAGVTAAITVQRVGGTNGSITSNFSTSNGSAQAPGDYTAVTNFPITYVEGETGTKTVNVTIVNDTTFEGNETVNLSLSHPPVINAVQPDDTVALVADPYSAVLTITENDPAPTFTINTPITHAEGNIGTTSYVFTVTKTGSTALSATVDYATVNGTASAPSDYTAIPATTLTFAPADTTMQITVLVNGDTTVEPDEAFTVHLSNATNSTISSADGTGTITNDDTDVTVAVSPASVAEDGVPNLVYTFTRTGVTTGSQVVNFSVGGTAAFSSDYTQSGATSFSASSGTVTFGAGNSTATVTVDPSVDSSVENNETVILTVTSGTGYNVASPSAATGTITNDDTDVTVAVSPASVSEDGVANLVYTFTRAGVTTGALTVNFSVGGTAAFSTDYAQTGAATFGSSSGTVTFGAGNATATVTIDPTPDIGFESNETVILTVTTGTGYNVGSPSAATGTINNDDAAGGIIQFTTNSYITTENSRLVTITVERLGSTSGAVTANYATPDDSEALTVTPCSTNNTGFASPRCDFTTALGTIRFADGDSTPKTFDILISQDSYVEPPENLTVTLSNLTGSAVFGANTIATVRIDDDDTSAPVSNPIDDPQNFVRQHYHDFLNREPDASGLAFWTNEITSCGSNQQCIDFKRVQVSAAFYLSIEFQDTGYLVERLYKTSYGDANGASTFNGAHSLPVPIVRFTEFLGDTQEIGQGVVVGAPGWPQALENNKVAFADRFVQRARFVAAFPSSMTPAQFVDKLNLNAGNPLSQAERDQLVADLTSNAKTRAQVLRAVAEDQDLKNSEFNRAFVLMQYFGYLRRNPNVAPDSDYSGYDFWLTKLNQFNGNFQNADMVKAFINSTEYRSRSGP